jgi:hypothetical protein
MVLDKAAYWLLETPVRHRYFTVRVAAAIAAALLWGSRPALSASDNESNPEFELGMYCGTATAARARANDIVVYCSDSRPETIRALKQARERFYPATAAKDLEIGRRWSARLAARYGAENTGVALLQLDEQNHRANLVYIERAFAISKYGSKEQFCRAEADEIMESELKLTNAAQDLCLQRLRQ